MPRNLIISCDGTNNSLKGPPTNVCHLSKLADIADETRQRVFYDAGVGVDANPDMRTRIGAVFSRWSGSAFGTAGAGAAGAAAAFVSSPFLGRRRLISGDGSIT